MHDGGPYSTSRVKFFRDKQQLSEQRYWRREEYRLNHRSYGGVPDVTCIYSLAQWAEDRDINNNLT